MSDKERLVDIKEIQNNATFIHEEGDPRMELDDEIRKFWEQEHTDWLIEQAEMFQSLAGHHDAVLAENKRLREALEFYADPISYETNVVDQWEPVVMVNKDFGEIARAALEEK